MNVNKIAIANRDPNAYPGGDLIVIDNLMKEYRKLGYEVAWPLESVKPDFSAYDVVHAHHLNFGWSNIIYTNLWEQNKPYFITATFYPTVDAGSTAEQMREYVNKSLFTATFSNLEKLELVAYTGCNPDKIKTIPNGTELEFFNKSTENREGIITVSAREGKNTKIVEEICKDLHNEGIDIHYRDITNIPREQMPDIYKKSKVFVNTSDSERMSLTTGEALCSNCRVIDTVGNRGNSWYNGLVKCDPRDYHELKGLIGYAYLSDNWSYLPNNYARRITWNWVAERYLECLKEL